MTSQLPRTASTLSTPIQFLKGIGPKRSAVLETIGIKTVFDLMMYVPRRYLDRSAIVTISQLRDVYARVSVEDDRRDYTVLGEVRSFSVIGFRGTSRFVLVLGDQTGSMQCVWFGGVQYWKSRFHVGEILAVSGQPAFYRGVLQFVHPDLDRLSPAEQDEEVDWTKALHTGGLVPLYSSSKELERVGLDSAGFRRVIGQAMQQHLHAVYDALPEWIVKAHAFVPLSTAIHSVHFPKTRAELDESLRRLRYEEFFYFQLKLALKRHWVKEETQGITFNVKSRLARTLVDSLPFDLTPAQVRVVKEITDDMSASKPLNRLLQGDVGSGKTIVALIAMLIAVENGYQAAFVAPTEILAEQHITTLRQLLKEIPATIRLLVGGQRSKLRREVLDDVRRGSAQIVVGTHALLEENVEFSRLGFVVIDEQHRFGVMQRASIRKKGENPDVLVMTATPIPRTLSLTLYGDFDVSIIDELPQNRKPIRTLLRYDEEKEDVYRFVREQVREGRQAYVVYPLIEESEKLDLKAATVHFEDLRSNVFADLRVGLLHGRMSAQERDQIMEQFGQRQIDILVATTVIEVGIDMPNASVMVIENAERFGLSQLHQLRGRVGRGSEQSYCILMAKKWIAKRAERIGSDPMRVQEALDVQRLAERRLATMVSTVDGFKIAEMDLQLRGPGDFFGTRQSGMPEFRVANVLTDTQSLHAARADAFDLVARDHALQLPEHRMLAEHLRTYFREALSLLRVG